jgi:hypothetical protein
MMRRLPAALLLLATGLGARAAAHEIPTSVKVQAFLEPRGDRLRLAARVPLAAMRDMNVPTNSLGYLDLSRVDSVLRDAAVIWIANYVEIYEGDRRLGSPTLVAARVSLPSDRSFDDYQSALAHLSAPPLPPETEIYWAQGLLDVLFEYPIESDRSEFAIHPGLERLGLSVANVLRFIQPDGTVRAFDFPGNPGLIRLDPRWHHVFGSFVRLGFLHILEGTDHLLFLFCLIIPFRRFRELVLLVTAFTAAHSVTLAASAYGMAPGALWFPLLVETLIATSIVYMALENILGGKVRRRWLITFGFGLVHGFGFSFALRETLQFAGSHLITSLLAFNLGVELGQLLVLSLLVPLLSLLFHRVVPERAGTIVLSALVAHTGWHWMVERGSRLREFDLPELDLPILASAMRWMMIAVGIAGIYWFIGLYRSRTEVQTGGAPSSSEGTDRAG